MENALVKQFVWSGLFTRSPVEGKWFVVIERPDDAHLYLWPDGYWSTIAWMSEDKNAYYNTRKEAEAALAKVADESPTIKGRFKRPEEAIDE